MPSLKEFAEAQSTQGCKVCALPEKLRAEIEANPDAGHTVVSKWLEEKGHPISDTTVRRHRSRHVR